MANSQAGNFPSRFQEVKGVRVTQYYQSWLTCFQHYLHRVAVLLCYSLSDAWSRFGEKQSKHFNIVLGLWP